MTHPIVEAVKGHLPAVDWTADMRESVARNIVAEVLRLAREPSEAAIGRAWGCLSSSLKKDVLDFWQDGIDALRREVEEG